MLRSGATSLLETTGEGHCERNNQGAVISRSKSSIVGRRFFLILLGAFFYTASMFGEAPSAEKIGHHRLPRRSPELFPIYVAEKKGFFQQAGLRSAMVRMTSDLTTTPLSTQDDDYTTNGSALLTGVLKGMGMRVVMGISNRTLFSLVAAPDISSPAI